MSILKKVKISNELVRISFDYPDQIRVIIDELVDCLNDEQITMIEDLIVNQYGEN